MLKNLLKVALQKLGYRQTVYLGNNLILTEVFHYKMLLPTTDLSMTPGLILDGYWEPMVTKLFLDLLRPGMIVLDIGAAFGYYTLLSADKVGERGKVISFEPEPSNFEIIEKNIFLNGFQKRVMLINKAVADKEGTALLHYKKDYVCGAPSLVGSSQEKTIKVETITIDNFLHINNIKNIDIVKIDVEGYEPFVIKGMENTIQYTKRLIIILEFSPLIYRSIGISPESFLKTLLDQFTIVKKINLFNGKLENINSKDLKKNDLFMCYCEK